MSPPINEASLSPKINKNDVAEQPTPGCTFSGKVFSVPVTKGFFEYFWMGRLGLVDWLTGVSIAMWLTLWGQGIISKEILLFLYLFWRLAYNVGLGWILREQSRREGFFRWAERYLLSSLLFKRLLKPTILRKLTSHDNGAQIDEKSWMKLPNEYKSWLTFRMLVDLILFHDFCHFFLFALSYNETLSWREPLSLAKVFGGSVLIWFNWWVKSDAHRVVKDYAWYWGDFFFRLSHSSELTFDGVFELAPHPMYSLGYVGYYGVALVCSSYVIFFVSLAAHCLQLAFLILVETPHMDKIYGSPPAAEPRIPKTPSKESPAMVLFGGFDAGRATDLMTALLVGSTLLVHWWGAFRPWTVLLEWLLWRAIFCGILGYVLGRQDQSQFWTRYHQQRGRSITEAFANWKAIYNFALLMNWTAFLLATIRCYRLEHWHRWSMGGMLLRHTLGLLMILLQTWTSWSIYETLGPYGWFYGDFFHVSTTNDDDNNVMASEEDLKDEDPKSLLYDSGVYRYLNNPEKVVGQAAYFGLALIAGDWRIALLAIIAMVTNYAFLERVERPHMLRIYGADQLGRESGVVRAIRRMPGARPVVEVGGRVVRRCAGRLGGLLTIPCHNASKKEKDSSKGDEIFEVDSKRKTQVSDKTRGQARQLWKMPMSKLVDGLKKESQRQSIGRHKPISPST